MKFAILSDTHYISKKMLPGEQDKRPLLRHKINRSFFESFALQQELDTMLITGDLTDDGDYDSHREFAALLKSLQEAGKKVYVLTATHDFHFSRAYTKKHSWPVKYQEEPWETPWFNPENFDFKRIVTDECSGLPAADCVPPLVKVATAEDLWEIYQDFGPKQAFSVCASAYSYAVKLDEKLWCLMLNNNMRDVDAMLDLSPTYSPACYRWIETILAEAKEQGAFVFACTHHPLVPPVPAYQIGGTTRNMRNSRTVHTLADLGLTLVFSGHTHFADIGFASSDAGNVLCNVTTPSLTFLPPSWRTVEIFPDEHRLKTETVPVENLPAFGVDAPTLKEHFVDEFFEEQREKLQRLPHGIGKLLTGVEVRHIYPLCPKVLTAEEYQEIKHLKLSDILLTCAVNMQCGDGKYTPDTPVYKFMMGFAAAADSIIDAQPFVNVRKTLLGYSCREIVEPMLFNNYVPDNKADFVFDTLPTQNVAVPEMKSHAGELLMGLLSVLMLFVAPAGRVLTAAALPALTVLKKRQLGKKPYHPERY